LRILSSRLFVKKESFTTGHPSDPFAPALPVCAVEASVEAFAQLLMLECRSCEDQFHHRAAFYIPIETISYPFESRSHHPMSMQSPEPLQSALAQRPDLQAELRARGPPLVTCSVRSPNGTVSLPNDCRPNQVSLVRHRLHQTCEL